MKIAVTENTEVSSAFNDSCMTVVGLGSFSAPAVWLLLLLSHRTARVLSQCLFLYSYSPVSPGRKAACVGRGVPGVGW